MAEHACIDAVTAFLLTSACILMPVVSTGTRLAAPVPQQGGDSLHPGGAVFAV